MGLTNLSYDRSITSLVIYITDISITMFKVICKLFNLLTLLLLLFGYVSSFHQDLVEQKASNTIMHSVVETVLWDQKWFMGSLYVTGLIFVVVIICILVWCLWGRGYFRRMRDRKRTHAVPIQNSNNNGPSVAVEMVILEDARNNYEQEVQPLVKLSTTTNVVEEE